MFNWLLSVDIMGGGASAPDDFIESMNKKGDYSGLWIILGIVFSFVIICVSIYLFRNYLDKKRNTNENILQKQSFEEVYSNELKCLICNENSDKRHFCKTCYEKYKNATIEIKITTVKILSEDEEEHK